MSDKKQKNKKRNKRLCKLLKGILALILICVAGLFAYRTYLRSNASDSASSETMAVATVMRGPLSATVYGTGTTSAASQPEVFAGVDGKLTELRVSIGDEVTKGQILAVLMNDEIDDTITDLEFSLWDLDDTITGTAAGSKLTTIEVPVAGVLKAIYAQPGDDALAIFRRFGALAVISTDGRMKVTLNEVDVNLGIRENDRLLVTGPDYQLQGTVTEVSKQGTSITVTVFDNKNDGVAGTKTVPIAMNDAVTVTTSEGTTVGNGVLVPNKPMSVSSYGGTISKVHYQMGDTVKRGVAMFTMTNSPLNLKVENLRLQREAAMKELEEAKDQRESLIVLAPCDGIIATLDAAVGNDLTKGDKILSILEGEDMKLTIAVDELDVVSVEPGQMVRITVDALSEAVLTGVVDKVAPVGSGSGGVTTYDVALSFDAAGTGVRSGMNATSEIIVAEKEDALYIPVEALMIMNNETYVMVADADAAAVPSGMIGQENQERKTTRENASGESEGKAPGRQGTGSAGEGTRPSGGTRPEGAVRSSSESTERSSRNQQASTEESGILAWLKSIPAKIHDWVYAGIPQEESVVTGSLVKVTTGLQNDESVEIVEGLKEGQQVLYTFSETGTNSRNSSRQNSGGMMMNMRF